MKSNEMGGACGTYGEDMHIGIWGGILRERGHLKNLGAEGKIILKLGFK